MNTNLIDMFGLSGDQESDNRLDELLARLEADIENSCSLGSATYCQSSQSITLASSTTYLLPAKILAQRQRDC
jgi:hypothetical protein